MRCLRCPDVDLVEDRGVLHEAVCPRCQGRLFDQSGSSRVLEEFCGLPRALVGELCAHYAGRTTCPACQRRMSLVPVRNVHVDLCGGCGALYLDHGELGRLSGGRVEEPLAEATPVAPVATPATSAVELSSPVTLSSTVEAPKPLPPRPAGTRGSASVFLQEPLGEDDIELLVACWQAAGFRTALDARSMMTRAAGGIAVDDCTIMEATAVADAFVQRGRRAVVVDVAELQAPQAIRTKEVLVGDAVLGVADALGRPRQVPTSAIVALVAARARVVVTERAQPAASPKGVSMGRSLMSMAPGGKMLRRAMDGRAQAQAAPTTTMVERESTFLDVVVAGERLRLDADGLILRAGGPRSMADVARALDGVAPPKTFRQRGFLALLADRPAPLLKTTRDIDREVTWALWRRLQG
jgi:Zn-finger nucleic acid-binding protein